MRTGKDQARTRLCQKIVGHFSEPRARQNCTAPAFALKVDSSEPARRLSLRRRFFQRAHE